MKFKMRKGVFETNSSSVHSLCISENPKEIFIPNTIRLSRQEFGWESCTYSDDCFSKVDYLFESCIAMDIIAKNLSFYSWEDYKEKGCKGVKYYYNVGYINKLVTKLQDLGIKVITEFGEAENDGYIDHIYGTFDFVKELLDNDELFKSFLFCSDSFLVTGNDNDESYSTVPSSIEGMKVFRKGN